MNFYKFVLDPEQEEFVKAIMDDGNYIVFCNSAAGTGKTTIAFGAANILYHDKRKKFKGIMYIVSPYGETRQGYIPGTQANKSAVYFDGAYKAMAKCDMNINSCIIDTEIKRKGDAYVELTTHTYMRGDDIENMVIIIDEAQNFTVGELKKVLTRLHDSCKIIVIGHFGQVDISGESGFAKYIDHFMPEVYCKVCNLTINHRGVVSSHADKLEE